jgi:squamous cell carcinoma antigen recognized by T-cells 3
MSSDESDEEISTEQIEIAEQALVNNPFDIKNHLSIINLFRKSGNIEKLRKSKETMTKYFTLNDKIWNQFIEEEQNISTSKEDFQNIFTLYERALNDFQSKKNSNSHSHRSSTLVELFELHIGAKI